MQTYLFYDIESTGLNKAFDQVLQFAAIRTDLQLNELARYELKVKLNPDVFPSPQAMLTHHIRLKDLENGITEYQAIKQIHEWMNTPGTISLGYNTLSFDDEFLRFSFYRNLFSPYTHQFANQCSRMDIYPITIMYYLFKNACLRWPIVNDKPSFKLEYLNQENQFATGRAHDAMVDVEATLGLTKKLAAETEMWNYLTGYFQKKMDQDRIQKLGSDEALFVLGKLGTDRAFQSIVLSLGTHFHYTNQLLWLRLDETNFSDIAPDQLIESTWVLQKKCGEPGFILPLKDRFTQHLTPERIALAKKNKQWLQDNPTLFRKISDHYRGFTYPIYPETDADASLYLNGFWAPFEENMCKQFHRATPGDKILLTEKISHPTLHTLAVRVLGRNFPELMTAQQHEIFHRYLTRLNSNDDTQAIIDFKNGKRLTPHTALEQIKELKTNYPPESLELILLKELEEAIHQKLRYNSEKFSLSD